MARYGSRSSSAVFIVSGVAGTLFGIIVGYVMAVEPARPVVVASAVAAPAAAPLDERELQAYRDILKADPKNARAATELGNRFYDAGRFTEAVAYYEQAMAIEPGKVGVSTDLATALWYAGRVDDALAQFDRSLAIDATHPQTLFNLGIVRRDGKNDLKGAVQAWEKLVETNPASAEAKRAAVMLDQARQQLATVQPTAAR